MSRIFTSLFRLYPEEWRLTLWMTGYHFLLLVTLYLLKPLRDSLFLSEVGAAELPFVFMLVAVVVAPVSLLYERAGRSLRIGRLVYGVTLFLVVNLVGLRFLIATGAVWVHALLYVWVSMYGVLVTSQFWLLANAVVDVTQAKRIFPLLSLGAILGAVAGGEVTGFLVEDVGIQSRNLLWVAGGLLLGTAPIVRWIRDLANEASDNAPPNTESDDEAEDRRPQDDQEDASVEAGLFDTIRRSRHLQAIIGVIALTVCTTTFVDYQFKTVAAAAYPTESGLTAFMGRFYGRVSLVAFLLQLFLGSKFISRLGVGGTIAALPLGLVAATVGMLTAPGLVAATLMRGTDQSLKHSIDKTGRELLFMPVPIAVKKRVKVFIDLFVDHGAQGGAGALLLLFTAGLGLGVWGISVIVLGFLLLWLGLVVVARGTYVHQFRRLLHRRTDSHSDGAPDASSGMSIRKWVTTAIGRNGTREIVEGLRRSEEEDVSVPASTLQQLLEHDAPEVRRRALRLFRLQEEDGFIETVASHLEDSDAEVRLEAARYIYQHLPEDRISLLREGLEHDDYRVRAAGLGVITKDGGPAERSLITEPLLRDLMAYEGGAKGEIRSEVARVLGALEDRPYRVDMLSRLLHAKAPQVVRNAIESAGYSGERDFVPRLLEFLTHETYREEARKALTAYGERVLGTLFDHLTDPRVSATIRKRIPNILEAQPRQTTADVLLLSLEQVTVPVRTAVVDSLSQIDQRVQELSLNEEPLRTEILVEARRYKLLGECLQVVDAMEGQGASYPSDRLESARSSSLERLFQLLGLRYNQQDLRNAYRGFTSADQKLQSSAVELLDNLLEHGLKTEVVPLLAESLEHRSSSLRGGETTIRSDVEALRYLLQEDDPRLQVPAVKVAVCFEETVLTKHVQDLTDHPNLNVRRAARHELGWPTPPEQSVSAPREKE